MGMSIHEELYKVKPKRSFLPLFAIMLISGGFLSLGLLLGSLGQEKESVQVQFPSFVEAGKGEIGEKGEREPPQSSGGAYVVSRNGTKYYPISCSGASRIKEENRVYFDTTTLAEAAGYGRASGC
jgi:hypothetical protein